MKLRLGISKAHATFFELRSDQCMGGVMDNTKNAENILVPDHKVILIVEDDEAILSSLATVLEMEGLKVMTSKNGFQALELLNTSSVLPDLILLDLFMPVMDGWELMKQIAVSNESPLSQIPVIAMSAGRECMWKDRLAGVELLKKPIDLDELISAVFRYCSLTNLV